MIHLKKIFFIKLLTINKIQYTLRKMNDCALKTSDLKFEEKELFRPSLDEIRNVLEEPLAENFQDVTVEVVDCPDLKCSPYNLVDSGLGGSPTLIEVGSPSYLVPCVDKSKIYDIKEIIQNIFGNNKNIFCMGAGAGPFPLRNRNCEGIYNMKIGTDGETEIGNYTVIVSGPEEKCVLEKFPNTETRCALLLNIFASQAKPGLVLRVHCKKRIGELNFIECIRLALANHYKQICVGLGGIFLLKNGSAHQHVMRDFSATEINTEEEFNNWLKFYEMPAVLNNVGTLITQENDLDLRLQHFHNFSNGNWGGHYHYDTTPDIVEYEGYFNVAEKIVRIDKPVNGHKLGKV